MRLTRIVAERFGALQSESLGDLGDGLTVVLGPNEAGKTTYAALARHVLYGFPTASKKGAYLSDAGKRLGRLVFASDDGEWVIERAEGPRGGQVALHTLAGEPRPDLVERVTRGVSSDAFRVVFGFGLDEMAAIEAHRDGDDVLSRLYAAQVGLGVSPSDVRAALRAEADELWRPRGKKELNLIKSRITEVKREIGALESEASDFAEEQAHLTILAEALEEARARRNEATAHAAELAAAAQRLADLEARIAELGGQEREAREALAAATEELAALDPDDRVLAVAPELDAALGELSGFRERLRRAAEEGVRVADLEAGAAKALSDAGMDAVAADAADLGLEALAGLERWRARLDTLASQATASERVAQTARDTARGGAPAQGRQSSAPGAVMTAAGLGLAVYAIVVGDTIQLVLGSLLAAVGIVFLARAMRPREEHPRAGAPAPGTTDPLTVAANRDAEELQAALGEWREWLEVRGLESAGDDPAAVALLVGALREYRSHAADAERAAAARSGDLAACEAYRDRVASLVAAFAPDMVAAGLEDIPGVAARLQETLETSRAAQRRREDLAALVQQLEREAASAHERLEAARIECERLAGRFEMPDADAVRAQAASSAAQTAAEEARDSCDGIAEEHTALATKLDGEGRDTRMADLRLELAGLEERRDVALDRYSVLAVAQHLIARVQVLTEQTRQPEVIRRASEVFSAITSGRYVRVAVPGTGEFEVFGGDAGRKSTSELSTGTAQQLYLALRIALIETLDEIGEGLPVFMDDVLVNFDPERKVGAAGAIAELAEHRQVVVFTCHPETAALFAQVVPGRTELSLQRC